MHDGSFITIKGARTHNLRNVDLTIPRDKLIVFTGLSGSGKSSLAFDTLYAEGKRRYMESLSVYARQILEVMQKPDVDRIDGLSPAVAIEQKTISTNPRSTVGTSTDIYDFMRLLWARVGVAHSPVTGQLIQAYTVTQMVDQVVALDSGEKIFVLAPVASGGNTHDTPQAREIDDCRRLGFSRLKVDGTYYEIDDPSLSRVDGRQIEVVVDRLVIKEGITARLTQSIERAIEVGRGIVHIEFPESNKEKLTFSTKPLCPVSGFSLESCEPSLFSFNNPQGACLSCNGLGTREKVNPDLIIDERLSLAEGAIVPWGETGPMPYYWRLLEALSRHYKFSLERPWSELPERIRGILLNGSGSEEIPVFSEREGSGQSKKKTFEGIVPSLERRAYASASTYDDFRRFMSMTTCEACGGMRLKAEALCVKIMGRSISDVAALPIGETIQWFRALQASESLLGQQKSAIMRPVAEEISRRLEFLRDVGLSYLTLARQTSTLSGGEAQRIQLASQIGSGLTGVLYVLDEPSIGLHQRDNDRLLETLVKLRDLRNTVVVVEHDEDAIRAADHVVDIGPGAGMYGGRVVAQGTPEEIEKNTESLTGDYLSGRKRIQVPSERRRGNGAFLTLTGANKNNLKNVDVRIPLGVITCFTGVSGSGKSTLVIQTLYGVLAHKLNGARVSAPAQTKVTGLEALDKVIDIDQSPIGRTPRSNPATYTGVFALIRDWYAQLPESRARGYAEGRFSFNVRGGRCEACQGDGVVKIEMHFLSDVYVSCDVCGGRRYSRETLEILYKEKSIADVLDMTVDEAWEFFAAIPPIVQKLTVLRRVGLGYIKLGQSSTTLSGGEAQRIKLSRELSRRPTGRTIYILDEPTTGLHFHDIANLLSILGVLADQGNSVVIIEHNLDVVKCADWIIDMGPEGGDAGGEIVVQGTPEFVATAEKSHTGRFLKSALERARL